MADNHYDVIIIGSGAGGGMLADKLASSGKRILLLERGGYAPREKDNWNPRKVNVEGKYNTKEVWHDKDGHELHPHTNYYVCGNTKFYGAALFRLRKEDFGEITHHGGVSPAWPITYDELEPYYTLAEQLYHVHGQRGEDPTDPPSDSSYPHPAVSHEPRIQQLSDDFTRHGLRPFHTPPGVMLNERNPLHSKCIRCETCDGFPCLVYAKADAQVCAVDRALEHGTVTLLTECLVEQLETSPSGREVSKVIVTHHGEREELSADVVAVSCGAIKSASGIKAFYFRDPDGHFLEILHFPPDKGDPKRHRPTHKLFLGIDHTAIVVADTDTSLKFYRDLLGMKDVGTSENFGTEQEHLNNVFGARLRITTLRAASGPSVEFLEYLSPRDGRPRPADARANDILSWQTAVRARDLAETANTLRAARAAFVSPKVKTMTTPDGSNKRLLVRDPDGHAVMFVESANESLRDLQPIETRVGLRALGQ